MNVSISDVLAVTCDVPQGTVLGPLLFLIYVNNLAELIPESVSLRLFANDCTILKDLTTTKDQAVLEVSIIQIDRWFDKWN